MNKKRVAIATVVLVLVGAGLAWSYFRTDPQVAELQQLRDKMIQQADGMSGEERREQFRGLREKMGELSDDQRREFRENNRGQFQQFMSKRMDEFFEKSPVEQRKDLDDMIDRMEERRQEREANGDSNQGGRAGLANASPQQRDQRRKERLDRSTPEMRTKMDNFRQLLNNRREQRGLDPIQGGRGFWGGRGGGGRGRSSTS